MGTSPSNQFTADSEHRRGLAPVFQALLALYIVLMGAPAQAQPAGSYRVGVGDVLRIEISTRPALSTQYTVANDGTVTIQGLGTVRASGFTTSELSDDLSRRLSLVDREIPRVTVTVIEARGRQIAVLGSVLLPGLFNLPDNANAWSAIELAGGASDDADLESVEIIPGDVAGGRQTVKVDIAGAIREGRLDKLEKLRAGDTVRVPRKGAGASGQAGVVYIFGSVGRQGAVPLDQAQDLLSLVVLSGGPGGDADLRHVEIVRRSDTRYSHVRVDLRDYLHTSNPSGNVPLQSGDTVYLPHRAGPNYLFRVLGIISPMIALTTSIIALSRR